MCFLSRVLSQREACLCPFFIFLVNDLQKCRLEEASKLKEINLKEVEAKELAIQEKVKYEAAKKEVDYVKDCAEREAAQKKAAEILALHEASEKEKLENVLVGPL